MTAENKKPGPDIVNDVLEDCLMAYPVSSFVISLYKQYRERGSLSKKQLQGLYGKASSIKEMSPGRLATLEAIIKKMRTKDKSAPSLPKPPDQKDETAGMMIEAILQKYPQHKRVLFLKAKYDHNELLTSADMDDLKRFQKLVSK
ncbi:MAG: hypothetical protein JWN76_111 [Chitinophagaceae bacterium]|nr:hypothetical protein [Chitinophagaceae bacterium]